MVDLADETVRAGTGEDDVRVRGEDVPGGELSRGSRISDSEGAFHAQHFRACAIFDAQGEWMLSVLHLVDQERGGDRDGGALRMSLRRGRRTPVMRPSATSCDSSSVWCITS